MLSNFNHTGIQDGRIRKDLCNVVNGTGRDSHFPKLCDPFIPRALLQSFAEQPLQLVSVVTTGRACGKTLVTRKPRDAQMLAELSPHRFCRGREVEHAVTGVKEAIGGTDGMMVSGQLRGFAEAQNRCP